MIEFSATEIGYYEEFGVVSCGASNAAGAEEYHYINFQRPLAIGGAEDEGVYFEIDDQLCGGYNIVASCELQPGALVITLSKTFKGMNSELIVVRFEAHASKGLQPIDEGLRKVFVGHENLLRIVA